MSSEVRWEKNECSMRANPNSVTTEESQENGHVREKVHLPLPAKGKAKRIPVDDL